MNLEQIVDSLEDYISRLECERDALREALRELIDEIRQGVDPSDVNAKSGVWDRTCTLLLRLDGKGAT